MWINDPGGPSGTWDDIISNFVLDGTVCAKWPKVMIISIKININIGLI